MSRFVRLHAITCALILASTAAADGVADMAARVDAVRAKKLSWKNIAWLTQPREALHVAAQARKPIIAWVFLGNPSDERC